jgi:hypothetical protein
VGQKDVYPRIVVLDENGNQKRQLVCSPGCTSHNRLVISPTVYAPEMPQTGFSVEVCAFYLMDHTPREVAEDLRRMGNCPEQEAGAIAVYLREIKYCR